jgi:hypothetical protein
MPALLRLVHLRFSVDRFPELLRQFLVSEVLIVEGCIASAAIRRDFERVQHAACGRNFDVRVVGMPHHFVAAEPTVVEHRLTPFIQVRNNTHAGMTRDHVLVIDLFANVEMIFS